MTGFAFVRRDSDSRDTSNSLSPCSALSAAGLLRPKAGVSMLARPMARAPIAPILFESHRSLLLSIYRLAGCAFYLPWESVRRLRLQGSFDQLQGILVSDEKTTKTKEKTWRVQKL